MKAWLWDGTAGIDHLSLNYGITVTVHFIDSWREQG